MVKSFFPNSLHTYIQDCKTCMGSSRAICLLIDSKDRVDKAIERLEKVGLWDEEMP